MKIRIVIGAMAFLALPLAGAAQETPAPGMCPSCESHDAIELAELIARFAKRTGKKVIIDPRVRAQVWLAGMDPNQLSYDKLLAILAVYQFVAVQQADWIVVTVDANARQLTTPVYSDRNFKVAAPDEVVTVVTPVKNVCVAQLVPVLRPLMPQSAHMAAYPGTDTLILSDHAANVKRILTIIDVMERNGRGCVKSQPEPQK
jgi:general secretion pathway protein D